MAEIMEFGRRVSSAFTFSPVESRLGLITFATDAQIMVNFNRFRGPEALIEARNAVKVKPHTRKYAGQALALAKEGWDICEIEPRLIAVSFSSFLEIKRLKKNIFF